MFHFLIFVHRRCLFGHCAIRLAKKNVRGGCHWAIGVMVKPTIGNFIDDAECKDCKEYWNREWLINPKILNHWWNMVHVIKGPSFPGGTMVNPQNAMFCLVRPVSGCGSRCIELKRRFEESKGVATCRCHMWAVHLTGSQFWRVGNELTQLLRIQRLGVRAFADTSQDIKHDTGLTWPQKCVLFWRHMHFGTKKTSTSMTWVWWTLDPGDFNKGPRIWFWASGKSTENQCHQNSYFSHPEICKKSFLFAMEGLQQLLESPDSLIFAPLLEVDDWMFRLFVAVTHVGYPCPWEISVVSGENSGKSCVNEFVLSGEGLDDHDGVYCKWMYSVKKWISGPKSLHLQLAAVST